MQTFGTENFPDYVSEQNFVSTQQENSVIASCNQQVIKFANKKINTATTVIPGLCLISRQSTTWHSIVMTGSPTAMETAEAEQAKQYTASKTQWCNK